MSKKRDKKRPSEEATLPKFEGFKPLAGGLLGFKEKLDAENAARKKEADAPKQSNARPTTAHAGSSATARTGTPNNHATSSKGTRADAPRDATRDADDELTFHRMMSGVTPLAAGGKTRLPRTADVVHSAERTNASVLQARAREEATKALDHLHSLVDEVARFEVSDDGKRVEGRRTDASPDLVRKLRHGMLPIDGQLDLHGLSATQAEEKLAEFLSTMRSRGERCVLVIHGKGERSPLGGVLRGEIAAWLSQGRAREHVAAFATAHRDDGGEGAVYVALRR